MVQHPQCRQRSGAVSGNYFYRIVATSVSDPSWTFSQTKKMVLLILNEGFLKLFL